eukprot:1078775_1
MGRFTLRLLPPTMLIIWATVSGSLFVHSAAMKPTYLVNNDTRTIVGGFIRSFEEDYDDAVDVPSCIFPIVEMYYKPHPMEWSPKGIIGLQWLLHEELLVKI